MIRSRAPHFPWRFKLLKIWGSKPYSGRFKIFLFFCFHFQILHRKVDIFYFNHFLISCRNQIKHVENFCFYWYLICKTRDSKMVKNKDIQFLWRIWKWKEKGQNCFDLPERRFKPQIFSNFPVHDLNFHVKWGARDQIKTSF